MGKRGLFITFEGGEGSGKTSISKGVGEWLKNVVKKDYILTKEPGSPHDDACLALRKVLLDPEIKVCFESEMFILMADRYNHVNNVVLPALNKNKIVLSDRYMDSTFAYQGFGRRRGEPSQLKYITETNQRATMGLVPDLTVLVMVKPEVGLARSGTKEFGKKDHFEKETLEFHQRVYDGFATAYEKRGNRTFFLIDSTVKSEKQCLAEVIDFLNNFLERKLNLGE